VVVHEVLSRPLYRGEIVWNRTRKRNTWGQKCVSDRPENEWLRVPAPPPRIVPEELWQAAHQRIADARAYYQAATKGTRMDARARSNRNICFQDSPVVVAAMAAYMCGRHTTAAPDAGGGCSATRVRRITTERRRSAVTS
jgi:hypothetical protein